MYLNSIVTHENNHGFVKVLLSNRWIFVYTVFTGGVLSIEVKPVCMTFEDYYASFSADSHPSFSVSPVTGRMDRRGGEPSMMEIECRPSGQAGELVGDLVINLPEDNSKICYKVTCTSF